MGQYGAHATGGLTAAGRLTTMNRNETAGPTIPISALDPRL